MKLLLPPQPGRYHGRIHFLWKEYFGNPLLWNGTHNSNVRNLCKIAREREYPFEELSQNSLDLPDFSHRNAYEFFWVDGLHTTSWVQEELKRRESLSSMHENLKNTQGRKTKREICEENDYRFLALLRVCAKKKDIHTGIRLHANILERGLLENNLHLASALINMYAKCGELSEAKKVLEELPVRDVVSWSALISGYAQHGLGHEALNCLERMESEGLTPDAITFTCILKACGNTNSIKRGKKIHDEIVRRGLLKKNVLLGNALVDMYAKCGMLAKAEEVLLKELSFQDVVSWNSLIAGHAQHGQGREALLCFENMKSRGFTPNVVTFICILQGCGKAQFINDGIKIHEEIMNRNLLDKDIVLGTALVDMYAKCGAFTKAREVLEGLPARNVVCWNALITGYVEKGKYHEALDCFCQLQTEGLSPDSVTCICILKACGSIGAIDKGKQIHHGILNVDWLKKDVVLSTALVDMYAKCGFLSKAQDVLEALHIRDVISWNALIGGYSEQGLCDEVMDCFDRMKMEGTSPNAVTFTCILMACGSIGAIDKGKEIHDEILDSCLLVRDSLLGAALVDMYAKCGLLTKAKQVLKELPVRSVVSWSALIAGYAQQGEGHEALKCFKEMQSEGVSPNSVTFLSVLSACSHAGLIDEAQKLFGDMSSTYGISPTLEHHTCMVLVFGCAGDFQKAMSVIKVMPSSCDLAVWLALLGSCRRWENVKLASLAFDQIMQVDDTSGAAYMLMANIFTAAGMLRDAESVEAMRLKYADGKIRGSSMWVDARGKIHSFSVKDRKHCQIKQIYSKIEAISFKLLQEKCVLDVSENVLHHGKKSEECDHSWKYAIACALINTDQGETIHVMTKNNSICDNCHFATSLISKIETREILLRDLKCLHAFQDGKCACGK